MVTEVIVSSLPVCTYCSKPAEFDFKTFNGHWAYGCRLHYILFRYYSELGTGKGQRLVLAGQTKEGI